MSNDIRELTMDELDIVSGGEKACEVHNVTIDLGLAVISISTCGGVWSAGVASVNGGPSAGAAGPIQK